MGVPPKIPKQPSIHQIRERIAAIRRVNLISTDIDFLKTRLELLFCGYALASPIISPGQVLYRGNLWSSRPTNIAEVRYPPKHVVTRLQRANRPGSPMFYSSIAREAPFFELDVKPGDHVAISHWELMEKLWVNNVGYIDPVFKKLQSNRKDVPNWGTSQTNFETPANRLVHNFLAEEFAREVATSSEHEYKISIAIAEKLMGNILGEVAEGMPSGQKFSGILYPALAMRANADNLVLLPEAVDKHLSLKKVEFIRVDEIKGDMQYQITLLDFADSFGLDGTIEWKGRIPHWVLPPGATATATVENGQWVLRDSSGKILPPV